MKHSSRTGKRNRTLQPESPPSVAHQLIDLRAEIAKAKTRIKAARETLKVAKDALRKLRKHKKKLTRRIEKRAASRG